MEGYLTAKEIAEILGVSRIAIVKRAQKEKWAYVEEKSNRGKPVKKFVVDALPEDIKSYIYNVTNNVTTQNQEYQGIAGDNATHNVTNNGTGYIMKSLDNQGDLGVVRTLGSESANQSANYNGTNNVTTQNQEYQGIAVDNVTHNVTNNVTESANWNKRYYTVKDIADILGVSKRNIQKRAKKESWSHIEQKIKGGKQKVFLYNELPKDVQVKIAWYEAKRIRERGKELIREYPELLSYKEVEVEHVPLWKQEIALARFDLVKEFSAKKSVLEKERFVEAYNTKRLYPGIYEKVGRVSLKTLYRWEKILEEHGMNYLALVPRWGDTKRGRTKVTDEEASVILGILLHQNRVKIEHAIRLTKYILKEKGIPSPSSPSTLRRFVKSFQQQHYDMWVLSREGEKALVDKVLPHLDRDSDVLKPGDILVADGHKCNFQVRDPFTGKPCRPILIAFYDWASRDIMGYSIFPTENIEAIHLALYRAILRLGRIPTVVYLDNGKAFRAKIFTGVKDFREEGISGLYARLGIHTIFARPYNARAKVVERFFETLESFERMLPSFVGTEIKDKPAKLLRNEKFMKYIGPNYIPTIQEAKGWFEKWMEFYRSQPHEGLHGLCPKDVFRPGPGVDPKQLYILMLSEKEARVYRNGIRLFGYWFWNEALYGLKEKVVVRYDLHDLTSVLVFSQDGEFLCEAKRQEKVHPAAKIFGDERSYTEIKRRLSENRKLKRLTKKLVAMGTKAGMDWQEVIDRVPEVADELTKQHREQAIASIKSRTDEVLTIDDAEIERVSLPEADTEERPVFENETDKYFYLMEQMSEGKELSAEDREFIEEYEKDPLNQAVVNLVRSQMGTDAHPGEAKSA